MTEEVSFPIKIINGKRWIFLIQEIPKATIRAIGMDHKPRRVQDEGKHHCFEITAEGNIHIKPKRWNTNISN